MQTSFSQKFIKSADGQRVDEILRKCVHCGFCNATCPTYQLTGDELDGPRGRIYLIKNFFEDQNLEPDNSSEKDISLKHLDRCLSCLACETTCPSGVDYGELVDIGRKHIDTAVERSLIQKLKRKLIIFVFSHPGRVSFAFSMARLFKPVLPTSLAKKIPVKPQSIQQDTTSPPLKRKMLSIKGCVQVSAAPQINSAAMEILRNADIQLDEAKSRCCGALAFHLTDLDKAHRTIRRNIDDWHQKLTDSHENLIVTSSGCSSFIKQYEIIMQDDVNYADKAKFVSQRCKDLSEITGVIKPTSTENKHIKVAFHSPCTLQHGQKINGVIEDKLRKAGYTLVEINDAHLCCGSAGSYSLLQEEFSTKLLNNKVANLEQNQPNIIATANIGCLMHLQSGTEIPVKHWIELLD